MQQDKLKVEKQKIKRGAHAATTLCLFWTLFSAYGVFDWLDARRYIGGPDAFIPLTIWGVHALLIGLAIYAWLTEKPTETLLIGSEQELEQMKNPTAGIVDIAQEKTTLKQRIVREVAGTILFLICIYGSQFIPGLQKQTGLQVVAIIFVGIMMLNVLGSIIRFFVFKNRANRQ